MPEVDEMSRAIVGAKVQVGGAVGTVHGLYTDYPDEHSVVYEVRGRYAYPDSSFTLAKMLTEAEPWSMVYEAKHFTSERWNDHMQYFDFEKVEQWEPPARTYDWLGHFDMPIGARFRRDDEVVVLIAQMHPMRLTHESTCTIGRDRIMYLSKEKLRLEGRLMEPNADGTPRYDKRDSNPPFDLKTGKGLRTCYDAEIDALDDYDIAGRLRMLMRSDKLDYYNTIKLAAINRIRYLSTEVKCLRQANLTATGETK